MGAVRKVGGREVCVVIMGLDVTLSRLSAFPNFMVYSVSSSENSHQVRCIS